MTAAVLTSETQVLARGKRSILALVRSPRLPLIAVGVLITIANAPYLTGWFDPNPLLQMSGLGQGVTPGLAPGRNTIDPNAGYTSQALAHRAILDWLHGHVPWWNPFEGLGSPLAGEMQSAAFFPLVVLLLIPNGQVILYYLLNLIAGFCTYFLLRRLSLTPWACTAGAVVFGLNGTYSWFRFAPSNPICFLPMALLAVEVIRDRVSSGERSRWWILSAAIALSILAGFPEMAYLDGLLVGLWTVFRVSGLDWQKAKRYLARVALGAVVGVALAAPLLVSFVDYLPHADVAGHSAGYVHAFLPRPAFGQVLFPYLFGPIFHFSSGTGNQLFGIWANVGGYLSVASLLLAVMGLWSRELRPLKLALAVWSALLVARTYGVVVASEVLNIIPGMGHVAAYRYMDASLEMSVAVLAAVGINDLLHGRVSRSRVIGSIVIVAFVSLLAYREGRELVRLMVGEPHAWAWAHGMLIWGLITAVLVSLAALRLGGRRLSAVVLVAILPIEAMVMFVVPEASAPRAGTVDTAVVTYLQGHIGTMRFLSLGPLTPNYGSYYGLASITLNDVPSPHAYTDVLNRYLIPVPSGRTSSQLTPVQALENYASNYERLGVKYVVAPSSEQAIVINGAPLPIVYRDSLTVVYQLPDVTPYFSDSTTGCTVVASGRSAAVVHCAAPSVLVRSELSMPGWHATVNGRAAAIVPAAMSLQAIRLPAGDSRVQFEFTPPHIWFGWLAALLGLLACAGAILAEVQARRSSHRDDGPPVDRAPGLTADGSPPTQTTLTRN